MNVPQIVQMLQMLHLPGHPTHGAGRDPFWPFPRPKTSAGRIAFGISMVVVLGGFPAAIYIWFYFFVLG
jgi:hypothetical protein